MHISANESFHATDDFGHHGILFLGAWGTAVRYQWNPTSSPTKLSRLLQPGDYANASLIVVRDFWRVCGVPCFARFLPDHKFLFVHWLRNRRCSLFKRQLCLIYVSELIRMSSICLFTMKFYCSHWWIIIQLPIYLVRLRVKIVRQWDEVINTHSRAFSETPCDQHFASPHLVVIRRHRSAGKFIIIYGSLQLVLLLAPGRLQQLFI